MSAFNRERWETLWDRLQAKGDRGAWFDRLATAYGENQRYYHNAQHISECLLELDEMAGETGNVDLIEVAIWFHDAIYDAKASDNEELSAKLGRSYLLKAGIDSSSMDTVDRLIMITKGHSAATGSDDAVMIDIDLSILGRPRERFAEYEEAIRKEYSWVPGLLFRRKRAEILRQFLDRKRIFLTDRCFERYEEPARENLAWALGRL